jgi:hypothetical protein
MSLTIIPRLALSDGSMVDVVFGLNASRSVVIQ